MEQPINYGPIFSELYDQLMSNSKYEHWNKLINNLVDKYKIKGNALDLACGTGTITKMLLDINFNVTGIDKSEYMIKKAKMKLEPYQNKVNLIISDLRDFKINQQFDLSVSFYDSLNHFL